MGKETYLGDGLYASITGPMIKLRAQQSTGVDFHVYLEPEVFEALKLFAAKAWGGVK